MADSKDRKRLPHHFKPGADNPKNTMPDKSGRQPGTPNKLTNVKHAVLGAFDKVGGEQYLVRLARSKKDRGLFTQLLAKTIPNEITGKDGGPIEAHVLHIAVTGLSRLDDTELAQLQGLLAKIGVNDIVMAANDDQSQGLLPPPAEAPGAAGATA